MYSWEVMREAGGTAGRFGLYIRECMAQGINPSYTWVKWISDDFARFLVDSGLAGDLYGVFKP